MGRRRKGEPPQYRLHKPSGQARVTVDGKRIYLGKFGSPESREAHRKIVRQWEDSLEGKRTPDLPGPGCTILDLVTAHAQHAERWYRRADGTHTAEVSEFRRAAEPLLVDFATTAVDDFRPKDLKAIRQKMIESELSLGVVNQRVGRIRRMFRWGVSDGLVQASTLLALESLSDLTPGRGEARETEEVPPVPWAVVDATLPFLASDQLRALVTVQRWTGCRPGEACIMKGEDIYRTGTFEIGRKVFRVPEGCWVWVVRAKMAHARQAIHQFYVIPPVLQELLKPWLDRTPDAYLFSPAEAQKARYERMRAARKSKVQPSQYDRKHPHARRRPQAKYAVTSYAHAIQDAVIRANEARTCHVCQDGAKAERTAAHKEKRRPNPVWCAACAPKVVPHWHPHMLRHSVEIDAERIGGPDAGRAVLGHSDMKVTLRYSQRDIDLAAEVLRKLDSSTIKHE
jgi:integrase